MGMLIVGRNKGEIIEIQIDGMETIIVKIMEIEGRTVKVGIAAPKEVTVHRFEIAEKIRRQGEKGNSI